MSASADPGSLQATQQPHQQQDSSNQQQLVEALTTALQRLAISSQSPSPAAVTSSQVYRDNLRTVKLPTFDGSGKQDKVNKCINIFTVLESLNGLNDEDLVRLAVQHLRGPALLWWVEAADSGKSTELLSNWDFFKKAFRQRFVHWNASTADTQKLLYGLRQLKSARVYFSELRQIRMRIPPLPNGLFFNIVYANVKPHCRAALTRLQQLRGTGDLSLDEIEDVCFCEDDAEFAKFRSVCQSTA